MPGSGVRVNIGKAIRFSNKIDAIDWSRAIAGREQVNCTSTGMASCTEHDDTYFCKAARMQGYESVLTKRYMKKLSHLSGLLSDMVELILCPREEPPEQTTACPQMLSYTASDGGPCTCNPRGDLLTCIESGDYGFMPLDTDYGTRPLTTVAIFAITNVGVALLLIFACLVVWMRRREARAPPREEDTTPLVDQVPSTAGLFVSDL